MRDWYKWGKKRKGRGRKGEKPTGEKNLENKNDEEHILVAGKPLREKENQGSFPRYLISWPFAQRAQGKRTVLLSCSASWGTSKLYCCVALNARTMPDSHITTVVYGDSSDSAEKLKQRKSLFTHFNIKKQPEPADNSLWTYQWVTPGAIYYSVLNLFWTILLHLWNSKERVRILVIRVNIGCLQWLSLYWSDCK